MIEQMDHVLSVEIPTLMRRLPGIDAMKSVADVPVSAEMSTLLKLMVGAVVSRM